MRVRRADEGDLEGVAALRAALWPDAPLEALTRETEAILAGRPPSTLPLVVFVAEDEDEDERRPVGFVEVGLRSHADGCDPSRSVGFVEGFYVSPEQRRRGVGRQLMGQAEAWAREVGCVELASDTWADSEEAQRAHVALGFEIVDRCVNFRKTLEVAEGEPGDGARFYGPELARVHHDHFGMVARGAARELLSRLSSAGFSSGRIVDLAAGTGILSRAAEGAGFDVLGVDLSEDMLHVARAQASRSAFVKGSLWSVALPHCVAVAAVGEAFSYAADPAAGRVALEARLAAIHEALAPGGVLLFDVAGPGRSGPSGARSAFWTQERLCIGLEEREDGPARRLTRTITLFLPEGPLSRPVREIHELCLHAPFEVEAALTKAGFEWERLRRYGDFELLVGWHAYAALKRP